MSTIDWDICRAGRAWSEGEIESRYFSAPAKMELIDGKLYCDDAQRLHMLGLLLENLGTDAAIQLGNPKVWRDAVTNL